MSFLILSTIVSHGVMSLTLFPIHAPSRRVASLSRAILILLSRGVVSFGFIFLEATIDDLCVAEPIGTISVFSMLNFAPDASHQFFNISSTLSKLSPLSRYRVVSSANMLTRILSVRPGIVIPFRLVSFLSLQASGSIARSKRAHESGSPCRTPLDTRNGVLISPLIATRVKAFSYSALIVLVKGGGKLNSSIVSQRYLCLILP